MQDISSEQELKQLLDEGRITDEEYRDLLETLRQKEAVQKPAVASHVPGVFKPRSVFGKAALIFMIIGFLILLAPILFNIISGFYSSASTKRSVIAIGVCPFLFFGFPCLLFAFIFGIIGWKTTQGKIAAIGVPCLGLLAVPGFLILLLFSDRSVTVVENKDKGHPTHEFVIHKRYSLDSTVGVLAKGCSQYDVTIDYDNAIDGGASLKITSTSVQKQVIRLFETGPIEVESRLLLYLAQLKSEFQSGGAYLEMWCDISGKGEFFSRLSEQPITGKTNWTSFRTPFRLESGQSPANIKLNLVLEGIGTVWIDGVVLASTPLN